MYLRVVVPPEPIVTPADIAGTHSPTDEKITALIAAATEELDGPTGRLGRCLGPQTLELIGPTFCSLWGPSGIELPCPPFIEMVSVKHLDVAGFEQAIGTSVYYGAGGRLTLRAGMNWPAVGLYTDAVRIRYRAGYDGENTEAVPERARQAIIMAVQHMMTLGAENLFLRSETVEGVGSRQYVVSEQAGHIIRDTARRLLSGLKVPRI